MRILLTHPPVGPNVIGSGILFMAEPLALETIAAPVLEHDVRIFDMRIEKDWDLLRNELSAFVPDVVGVTALTTETYQALQVLRVAKEFSSDILTIVGGQHATFMPEDFHHPFVDVIAIGEGVHTFKKLIEAHDMGVDLNEISGLAIMKDGRLEYTPKRPPSENLDCMPIPARQLTEKYRENYFRGTWRPYACMVTSRGCPYRCKFCSVWKTEGGRYRVKSPKKVLKELKSIQEDKVGISDDNFLHDIDRAEKIYELIKAEGIEKKYKLIGRSDTIIRRPDIIEKWKEIGMEIMVVGIESFRDEDLNDYNKKTSVRKNNKAIGILQENGVTVSAHFVVHQDYVESDFEALAEYVERMGLKQPVFCILTPLPGTDLYEETKHELLTADYEKYDFSHTVLPTRLPLEIFYQQFVHLYQRCYLKEGLPSEDSYMDKKILKSIFARYSDLGKEETSIPVKMGNTS